MSGARVYGWERYPEFIAARQYGRCIGRVLAALPVSDRSKVARPLIQAAVLMAQAIAGAHAECAPGEPYCAAERRALRDTGLKCARISRGSLRALKERCAGSLADVAAAIELLERVEAGLRHRPLPAPKSGVPFD